MNSWTTNGRGQESGNGTPGARRRCPEAPHPIGYFRTQRLLSDARSAATSADVSRRSVRGAATLASANRTAYRRLSPGHLHGLVGDEKGGTNWRVDFVPAQEIDPIVGRNGGAHVDSQGERKA
jgi:hypothetical protein